MWVTEKADNLYSEHYNDKKLKRMQMMVIACLWLQRKVQMPITAQSNVQINAATNRISVAFFTGLKISLRIGMGS